MRHDDDNISPGTITSRSCIDLLRITATVIDFAINLIGERWNGQITNERQPNTDSNPVSDLSVEPLEGGWTMKSSSRSGRCATTPGARRNLGLRRTPGSNKAKEQNLLRGVPRALGHACALPVVARIDSRRARRAPRIAKCSKSHPYAVSGPDEQRQAAIPASQRCVGRHRSRRRVRV